MYKFVICSLASVVIPIAIFVIINDLIAYMMLFKLLFSISLLYIVSCIHSLSNYTFTYASYEQPIMYCMYFCHMCSTNSIKMFANSTLIAEYKGNNTITMPYNNVGMTFYTNGNHRHQFGIQFFNSSEAEQYIYSCAFNVTVIYNASDQVNNVNHISCSINDSNGYYAAFYVNNSNVCDSNKNNNNENIRCKLNITDTVLNYTVELQTPIYNSHITCIMKNIKLFNASALYINVTDSKMFEFKQPDKLGNVELSCTTPFDYSSGIGYLFKNYTVIAGYNGTDEWVGNKHNSMTVTHYNKHYLTLTVKITENISGHYNCIFPRIFTRYKVIK